MFFTNVIIRQNDGTGRLLDHTILKTKHLNPYDHLRGGWNCNTGLNQNVSALSNIIVSKNVLKKSYLLKI